MSTTSQGRCTQSDLVSGFALGALEATDAASLERHLAVCPDCRSEARAMSRLVGAFARWPTDVLRPSPLLWERLAERIGARDGAEASARSARRPAEPDWEVVAPGISCRVLATDPERDVVSMLVRLAPGVEYPPHEHAAIEELHLLSGELWIDDRKLHAGDYNRADPGTADHRVWSETGCTCVLVTSTRDVLR